MCIILYNETGRPYDRDELSTAYDNNPHGVGFMWIENGKVRTLRGLCSKTSFFNIVDQFEGIPHALHLRWRTRGQISKQLCHPFRASHVGSPKSVYLMHNGTFMSIDTLKDESDTHAFARKMQDTTQQYGTDILFEESFLRRTEKNIQSFNKVIFLRDDGKVSIMNPEEWTVKNGIWYSNVYSLTPGYRKAKVAREAARAFKWRSKHKEQKQSFKGKHKKKDKKNKKPVVLDSDRKAEMNRKLEEARARMRKQLQEDKRRAADEAPKNVVRVTAPPGAPIDRSRARVIKRRRTAGGLIETVIR